MIKYIHLSLDTKHYNGITIAYDVYYDFVKFSYAITRKPDQYSKKIGRQITTERFIKNYAFFNKGLDGSPYNVNTKEMNGVISREYMLHHIGFNGCLKENFIKTLSLTDIKLKAIIPTICKVIALHNDEIYGTI